MREYPFSPSTPLFGFLSTIHILGCYTVYGEKLI